MKKYYLLSILFITNILFAQIPNGYYSTATGTGYALKTQLYNIIKDHNALSYTPGLWDLYNNNTAFKDNWYENNGTILDIYSEKPSSNDTYEFVPVTDQCGNYDSEGDCYNREHIIPQSVFNQQSPMVTDAFHIWPTDGWVNNKRATYPFGKVNSSPTFTSTNGSKLGPNLNSGYSAGYSGTVFEPIDEFKGDIARANFYFATRYESEGIASWSYEMFNGTNNQVFTETFKNILLTWHQNDPVSPRELAINNLIYQNQGNRNPFIDHPEWVNTIWNPSAGVEDEFLLTLNIYPNPASTYITLEHSDEFEIKSYQINTLLGQKIQENSMNSDVINVENLINGIYFLNIYTENAVKSLKIIIEK